MVIAIPEVQGRVSPVLDVASRLRWVRFEGRTERDRREIRLAPCLPWELARSLAELEVDVLICAGVSALVEDGLRRAGIRVVSQICGPVDDVLAAFQACLLPATLTSLRPGVKTPWRGPDSTD